MPSHKRNIKQMLHRAEQTKNPSELWADDYAALFQPREKNLYKAHAVPKLVINQPRDW